MIKRPESVAGAVQLVLQQWWIKIPAKLRRISPFLSAAWADGIYLTAWPLIAVVLPLLALLVGLVEGATHWSFHATMWEGQVIPQRAVAFAQIRLLLFIAAVLGSLSAQLGLLLVVGFALGDWFLAGPAFYYPPTSLIWRFLHIGVPQLISYLVFFMLAVQPVLSARVLTSSLRWPAKISGAPKFWATVILSIVLQGFLVSAWSYAAPMTLRPIWMWAPHGEWPPLTVEYFTTMVNPWLPGLTVAVAMVRVGLTWWVRRNVLVQEKATELAVALSRPGPRAFTQYLPAWASALIAALTVTLLAAGYMATFRLGLSLFIVIAVIFLIRGVVLPRIAIWTVWAAVMAVVPLLFRWLGVGLGTYLITQAIYLRPSSSILANQGAGAFAPELTGIVLGVVVLVLLMPLSLSGPNRPTGIGQLKFGRLLKRGALVFVIVALAHATPASAMMSYCADSYCCFFNNRNAILAVAALLIVVAGLFLLGGVALLAALAEATAELATGAIFDLFPAAVEGIGSTLEEVFVNGSTIEEVVQTSEGEIVGLANVTISGNVVTLSDVAIYPAETSYAPAGVVAMKQWVNQVADLARSQGFGELRITGVRYSGANPGKIVNRKITL